MSVWRIEIYYIHLSIIAVKLVGDYLSYYETKVDSTIYDSFSFTPILV